MYQEFFDEAEEVEETSAVSRRTWLTEGAIDVNVPNEAFNQALDEFIREERDSQLVDGVRAPAKGLRRILALEPVSEDERPPDIRSEYERQIEAQTAFAEAMAQLSDDHQDIETCQDYLRHEEEREEWDCETILSTYSTLDNHPSLIKVQVLVMSLDLQSHVTLQTPSIRGSRSGVSEANTSLTESTWISQGGTAYRGKVPRERKYAAPKTYTMPASASGSQTARILLKGKLQLPEGFGSEARVLKRDRPIEQQFTKLTLNDSEERVKGDDDEPAGDDSEGEDSDDEDRVDGGNVENGSGNGRRKETAEEKKLRKQRVKEDKRNRRELKKQLKIAFKSEYLNQVAKRSTSQDINSVRVYKYTV